MSFLDAILDAVEDVEGYLTPAQFLEVYRRERPEMLAFDTESPTWKWQLAESIPFALQFSWSKEHTYYVPCSRGSHMDQEAAEALYEVMLTVPTLIMHNGKYDLHVAKKLLDAFQLPLVTRRIEDTMILDAVLDEARHHGLKERCTDLGISFGDEDADRLKAQIAEWRETESVAQGREVGYDEVPARLMVPYARQDAYLTRELFRHLMMEMDEQLETSKREKDLREIYELEIRLQWVLFGMEERGMRVDLDFVYEQMMILTPQLKDVRKRLHAELGREVNPGSTDDVAWALTQLGKEDAIWVNPATNKINLPEWRLQELEKDPEAGELVHMVLAYRTAQKMLTSYYEVIVQEHTVDELGQAIVRPNIKQMGARTGRTSVTQPALQTIPREKGEVRGAFIARENHTLIFADYSQQELRALAHYLVPMGDTSMSKIYERGDLDLHTETAAAMYSVLPDEVTKSQRSDGKETNFALVYGAGVKRIASLHGVDEQTAKARMARVYQRFPGLPKLKRKCEQLMQNRGYVITAFGRRHREKNGRYAYKAVNSLVQGTGADMTKAAMVRIDEAFRQEGMDSMIVLMVHDEIIVESPDHELERAVEIIKEAMLYVPEIAVPMEVEVHTARRWSEK